MKKWSSSKQIKLGAVASYLSIGINIAAGLLYTPWLVHSIGQSDYGLYTLAGSLINLFMVDFGVSFAVSRFLSKYLAENRQDRANDFMGVVYKLYFFIDFIFLLITTVLFFCLNYVYSSLTAEELARFKIVYIIVAFNNFVAFPFVTLSGILTSYEQFFQLKLCAIFQKLSNVLLMVVALLLGFGLYALVTVHLACNFLTIALKYYFIRKNTSIRVNFKYWNVQTLKEIFGFSVWSTIISIAERFIFNIMPSILAALLGALSVAVFGVSSTIEGYVYIFSSAINGMFLPKTSRIITKEESKDAEILKLMVKIGRISLTISALIVIGFICAGKEFMNLWMGAKYLNAYYIGILMILPDVVYAPQQIARTVLVAENKIKYQAIVYVIISVVNVALSFILCPLIGEIGAGIAIFVAYTLRLVLMTTVYKKVLKIDVFSFFKECHFKMAPALAISFVTGLVIFQIHTSGWIFFGLKCCLLTLIYFVSMWFLAFNSFEKNLFFEAFEKVCRIGR